MELNFLKYHGTGNDFVILDQLNTEHQDLSTAQISYICSRHFGIGADGLMIIRSHDQHDFEMIYYNSDGNQSSMCGNGGRCIVHYAAKVNHIKDRCTFLAIDGVHHASISEGVVALAMNDVVDIQETDDGYVLDTGSPHLVASAKMLDDKESFVAFAKKIRYNDQYEKEGINVNAFVDEGDGEITGITYERGVEDITLSCGTGVTAMALVHAKLTNQLGKQLVTVNNIGGQLQLSFEYDGHRFTNIWLIGPATFVYEGQIEI